jgi:hypothetical protein
MIFENVICILCGRIQILIIQLSMANLDDYNVMLNKTILIYADWFNP